MQSRDTQSYIKSTDELHQISRLSSRNELTHIFVQLQGAIEKGE